MYKNFFKRLIDFTASFIGLIIAAIPMAITAVLVRIYLGAPIIFKQERVGRHQKRFYIYKFRTMTDKRDENGELLPDPERFTKFGKILRKTSLDELPQLFNVLKGDISLIGPRPMMPKYIPSDIDIRAKRFSIRPGITGMAQINGRTNITYSQRFEYDVKYAEAVSFFTDMKVFFGTVLLVLKSFVKKDGSAPREEDMEMLKGTMEYERLLAVKEGRSIDDIRKNKIIIFANEYNSFCNYRLELLEKLRENGHRVVVVLPCGEKDDTRVMDRCDAYYDFALNNRGTNPVKDLGVYFRFKKILKKEKPDIVLTIAIKPNIYGGMACASLNIPNCALIQGLGSGLRGKGLVSFIAKALYKIGIKRSKKVFVEGKKNADKLIETGVVKGDKVVLLEAGPGVNLERFDKCPLPGNDGEVVFLFMSRILKEKGVDELLETFDKAKEKYGERVKLNVLGRCVGDYESVIFTAQEKGVLNYYGFQKDVKKFIVQAHCIILPSYHEGVSIALMEGEAMGRPVITTNADGCDECVQDGLNGYKVDVANADQLFEAVCKFVELPFERKKEMSDNARLFVEERFDRKTVNNIIYDTISKEARTNL